MSMISVEIGSEEPHQYANGISVGEVILNVHGKRSGAVAALVDGVERDFSYELETDCSVEPILGDSDAGLYILRHSCAHLLAQAVTELFPDAKPTIGPPIDHGFYYDFHMDPIGDEELRVIEKKMNEHIRANHKIIREEFDNAGLREVIADNKFKLEIMDEKIGEEVGSSAYRQGDFIDMCRGPHAPSTSHLRFFKLTSTSQAYWRADSKREPLTRIYGMCYATKEGLKVRQQQIQEAGKRDHKKIGKEMELYMIDELIGKGLPVWLPNGEILKSEIERFAVETEETYGYDRVTTPVLAKQQLFECSGHLPHYADGMYPPIEMDDGTYYLKAMNCPMHHLVFRNKKRSYRDLPIRIAEYGTVYRNELSGTLAGLLRVRMLSMNDAHIYCTLDQVASEFADNIRMVQDYYATFGFTNYHFRLSLWDPENTDKYIGQHEIWEATQNHLRKILDDLGVDYVEAVGEAAFYGPKIDIQFTTALGREESMSTIQLDFAAKDRFELSFKDENGNENGEVFVIHRAPLSTHERFVAFLTEHWIGNFPTWLSPIQVQVITISEKHKKYAAEVGAALKAAGVRVKVDDSDATIGKKIRMHRKMRPAYMIILGDEEVTDSTVSIRARNGDQCKGVALSDFVSQISEEISNRSGELALVPSETSD
ncbi:MAG: threonine--tRNA ligase [Euryarchaeota archaeon]|jgi:threonyl-tRNA synthetase|nr:threonine--tRNA ligase [Euryarchaeota archaeon]MBT3653536.1 threonine--tRNA ligase [Euryarchaeota archaeon]MBT3757640.1 threonine--tRNA ligase [Euryarchaeota archaeon]MBT4050920.1 threonine--tRNA ligase [Euryarchaeota archaeon]MBT4649651.1 threonine--tRNA ligase [Euryarchaeota archaeon]